MPVASLEEIVDNASDARYGEPAINTLNGPTMRGVLDPAGEVRSPVIELTSVKTVRSIGTNALFARWRSMTADIDDVSVQDSTYTVGRCGVAGNFFVMKAVGAAAEAGADLEELMRIGEKINSATRTTGVALTACTPPSRGGSLFELGGDEIDVRIHGEFGRRRAKWMPADEIVGELLGAIIPDLPLTSGDRVAVMVNGLGGTPISVLYILYGIIHKRLTALGMTVGRAYVGDYCTSLGMAAASITLVRLDDEIETVLAAPAEIAMRVF